MKGTERERQGERRADKRVIRTARHHFLPSFISFIPLSPLSVARRDGATRRSTERWERRGMNGKDTSKHSIFW